MLRARPPLIAVAILAALVLVACGSDDPAGPGQTPDYGSLDDAPPKLADLYAKGDALLAGGPATLRTTLENLEGHPVVVNKWASWCGPCRAEAPFFQSQVAKRGDEIAFLGVNSNDSREGAEGFLADYPVPYPSIEDPKLEVAKRIDAILTFPSTVFYDASGKRTFVHQGQYRSEADLEAEITKHATGG
ncbi:MAG: TlpA family protein disulfide reductase [Solirubrobacterales bacterium]